jgi:dimethylargininase
MTEPKLAIVREPGKSYKDCISCHPLRDTIDMTIVREQHGLYRRTLVDLGLEVVSIPPDDRHADACFVEDNAVIHGKRALICRMGEESRRGEETAVEQVLKQYVRTKRAKAPATVEGGDVIHFDDRLLSGVSQRTNQDGVDQMGEWLEVRVDTIVDPAIMHLKSYVTSLGGDTVIATDRYSGHSALKGLDTIFVPKGEEYAADTLTIGDTVIMPAGHSRAQEAVRKAGFRVVSLDMSEFEKCGGALTCLSLLL